MTVRYKRTEGVLSADVADDVVVLHPAQGHCYGMPGVSAAIWNHLADPISVDELCARLQQEFDVERQQCIDDTTKLLDQMLAEQLVTVVTTD